jgi:fumarate hydratase class I
MLRLRDGIVELYRKVATSLPPDVEAAIKAACGLEEEGTVAGKALSGFIEEARISREKERPLCLEPGIPVFYVSAPLGISHKQLRDTIIEATRLATEKIPLSPGAVDVISAVNSGDNTGMDFPETHINESPNDTLTVELMLRGAECEREGVLYRLPDEAIKAGRDLKGVSACVLDAVSGTRGRGCPPYTLGVGIGATRAQATGLSKEQLRRKLNDRNPVETLMDLEDRLLGEINAQDTAGGYKVTALGVKIGAYHRHLESFFVDVSFSCLANRRGKLIW